MESTTTYELSDLDKMGIMKSVNLVIFYKLLPNADLDTLLSSWKEGMKNATRQLPFMAGHLQFDDSGRPCIEASPGHELEFEFRRFDTESHQGLSALAKSSFSPNGANLPQFLPDKPTTQKPVCDLRLSLIDGGLVLGVRMNHGAGD